LKSENIRSRSLGVREVWDIRGSPDGDGSLGGVRGNGRVSFTEWVNDGGWKRRTEVMKELCERWRDTEEFCEEVCGPRKWRGELYPVYKEPFGAHDHPSQLAQLGGKEEEEMNYAFEMERSACALFGVVTYGVHMSIYAERIDKETERRCVSVWVPTRARTKQT
jgi:hypothetical protein